MSDSLPDFWYNMAHGQNNVQSECRVERVGRTRLARCSDQHRPALVYTG